MNPRQTLRAAVSFAGTGLFTGGSSRLTILPAPAETGMLLSRADLPGSPSVALHLAALRPSPPPSRNTTLGTPGWHIATVEHVVSAVVGMGITDAIIEVSGGEVPLMDGSALLFVEAIRSVGVAALEGGIEPLSLMKPVCVSDGKGGSITAAPRPAAGFSLTYHLDLRVSEVDPGPLAPQSARWDGDPERYAADIAPARTFCQLHEAEAMRKAGLFAHLSERDIPVIAPDGSLMANHWRLPDEPARHKLLDLIGDLALIGRPLQADIVATRSGHALTHELCRAILRAG